MNNTIRNINEELFSTKWCEMSPSEDVADALSDTGNRVDPCFSVKGLHDEWDYENNCYASKTPKKKEKK